MMNNEREREREVGRGERRGERYGAATDYFYYFHFSSSSYCYCYYFYCCYYCFFYHVRLIHSGCRNSSGKTTGTKQQSASSGWWARLHLHGKH